MKAICVDINGFTGKLTLNKKYNLIRESKFSPDFILVEDDNRNEYWATKSRFKLIN
jgi:hypothetical protein